MVSGASRGVEFEDYCAENGCTISKAEIEVQAPSASRTSADRRVDRVNIREYAI
jgi:hypothetical protein